MKDQRGIRSAIATDLATATRLFDEEFFDPSPATDNGLGSTTETGDAEIGAHAVCRSSVKRAGDLDVTASCGSRICVRTTSGAGTGNEVVPRQPVTHRRLPNADPGRDRPRGEPCLDELFQSLSIHATNRTAPIG